MPLRKQPPGAEVQREEGSTTTEHRMPFGVPGCCSASGQVYFNLLVIVSDRVEANDCESFGVSGSFALDCWGGERVNSQNKLKSVTLDVLMFCCCQKYFLEEPF